MGKCQRRYFHSKGVRQIEQECIQIIGQSTLCIRYSWKLKATFFFIVPLFNNSDTRHSFLSLNWDQALKFSYSPQEYLLLEGKIVWSSRFTSRYSLLLCSTIPGYYIINSIQYISDPCLYVTKKSPIPGLKPPNTLKNRVSNLSILS